MIYHDPTNCCHCQQHPPTTPVVVDAEFPGDLGVLQTMWDAWTPAQAINADFELDHYYDLLVTQIMEICEHEENGQHIKALYEMVDIISVAMNLMRNAGVTHPKALAYIIRDRVAQRYEGQTLDIVNRDLKRYGKTPYEEVNDTD